MPVHWGSPVCATLPRRNYMKRWNTWPLRSQGFFLLGWHVFPQLNWLTDWKKVSQKDLEKVKGEKRSWSCVTEEVVHSILWCTQSTYTQQWQTAAAARNELKDCLYCSFCELFSSALFLSLSCLVAAKLYHTQSSTQVAKLKLQAFLQKWVEAWQKRVLYLKTQSTEWLTFAHF